MAVPIDTILVSEIKKFYPVTNSLAQAKIDEFMTYVQNITFMQMFGLSISTRIFSGEISDQASENFIGFRAFVAMCIAGQLCEETYVHTNAGLKAINQPNWSSPTAQTKNTTLIKLNNAIEVQFIEAKKILATASEKPANTYEPYSSFQIDKI